MTKYKKIVHLALIYTVYFIWNIFEIFDYFFNYGPKTTKMSKMLRITLNFHTSFFLIMGKSNIQTLLKFFSWHFHTLLKWINLKRYKYNCFKKIRTKYKTLKFRTCCVIDSLSTLRIVIFVNNKDRLIIII